MPMMIIKTTNVPDRIRGRLSRYLLEIDPGLYIGNFNNRTRSRIWSAIISDDALFASEDAVIVMAWATQDDNGFSFISFGERRRHPFNLEGLILSRFLPMDTNKDKDEDEKPKEA